MLQDLEIQQHLHWQYTIYETYPTTDQHHRISLTTDHNHWCFHKPSWYHASYHFVHYSFSTFLYFSIYVAVLGLPANTVSSHIILCKFSPFHWWLINHLSCPWTFLKLSSEKSRISCFCGLFKDNDKHMKKTNTVEICCKNLVFFSFIIKAQLHPTFKHKHTQWFKNMWTNNVYHNL